MDDHFDTSGVFEISKFDISKFACISTLARSILTLAGNKDKYKVLDELEFQPDPTFIELLPLNSKN